MNNDLDESYEANARRRFIWTVAVIAVAAVALFVFLAINPAVVAVAPFALGCFLEFVKGGSCAP